MNTIEFQIGDRVRVIKNVDHLRKGDTGTIIRINPNGIFEDIAVEWDVWTTWAHDCGGLCERGYGWWVYSKNIEHVDSEEETCEPLELMQFL